MMHMINALLCFIVVWLNLLIYTKDKIPIISGEYG